MSFYKPSHQDLKYYIEKRESEIYVRYGLRKDDLDNITKAFMSFEDFSKFIVTYYEFTKTEEAKKKGSSFFRQESAQKLFNKINGITTINQCWNFQKLSEADNNKKGQLEKKIQDAIKKKTLLELSDKNPEVKKYFEEVRKTLSNAIEKGKVFFAQANQVREKFNEIFTLLKIEKVEWESVSGRVSCITQKSECDVCSKGHRSSYKWRCRYFCLYQKPKEDIGKQLGLFSMLTILGLIYQNKSQDDLDVMSKKFKAESPQELFLEVQCKIGMYPEIYYFLFNLAKNYCLSKAKHKTLKNENLVEKLSKGKEYTPYSIRALIDSYLDEPNEANRKIFLDKLHLLNSPQLKNEVFKKDGAECYKMTSFSDGVYLTTTCIVKGTQIAHILVYKEDFINGNKQINKEEKTLSKEEIEKEFIDEKY
ncbi:hypothetical protein CYY_002162 [Polysphondylium violaceum]|uniref:Uncharacterized protein n=1 Tax=Polysphondylium violaceum TaxID=133409 RepID=A0A8J4PX91_9MYCE|nr:hypothetical protein CYY_002162 [Polysphondylium violaceum]